MSCFISGEAEKKYGSDKLKIYTSKFTPLYYALTERKSICHMKLICLLPEEKVILPQSFLMHQGFMF